MVGYNSQRNILFGIIVVFDTGDTHYVLHNVLNRVDFKEIVNALHDACESFKSHARIYIRMGKAGIAAVAVVFKLRENKIPYLDVSVALASYLAAGLSASLVGTAVKINLRTGTAWTCAVLPEVIFLSEANHVVGSNADFLSPYIVRFIIVKVNAYIKLVLGHFENLGEELPRPRRSFAFEIIAEREVSEHFKKRAVSCRLADVFNVGRTDTFLTSRDALSRRSNFARKIFFHRSHSRIYKQYAIVALRYEREARQSQMTL